MLDCKKMKTSKITNEILLPRADENEGGGAFEEFEVLDVALVAEKSLPDKLACNKKYQENELSARAGTCFE